MQKVQNQVHKINFQNTKDNLFSQSAVNLNETDGHNLAKL